MLSVREKENARQQAIRSMRARLEATRPDVRQYVLEQDRASAVIAAVLVWARAFVPVIALLAALASAVRTVQAVTEIYTAAGSAPIGVLIAAVGFTVSCEFALFVLALAQEGRRMRYRAEKRARSVASLRGLWRGVLVRVGVRDPLRHDELPERDGGLATVTWIAFTFAVASNVYLGLRPLTAQIGDVSLQAFLASILNAPAATQLTFIVDIAAVLFPPLMARQAGHLTAQFAAEVASARAATRAAYEADLEAWRRAYADPLATDEGKEVLAEIEREKLAAKTARQAARPTPAAVVPSGNGHNRE